MPILSKVIDSWSQLFYNDRVVLAGKLSKRQPFLTLALSTTVPNPVQ
jgi:hypothetical protein